MSNSHRLRLCAATACAGLLLLIATAGAALRARVDNANQNAVSQSSRQKVTRRKARRTRRRAKARNPSLPILANPPVIPPGQAAERAPRLPVAPTLDVDPALYKDLPQVKYGAPNTGTGSGNGTGAGLGPGRGRNMGGGMGTGSGTGEGSSEGSGSGVIDYNRPFSPRDVDQKARILSKPDQQYTPEAKKNQVSGTVILRVVLSSTGEVTNIRAVTGLPDGLTEQCVEAARGIKFEPAMKDGRAVSQYIQLEYSFNPY